MAYRSESQHRLIYSCYGHHHKHWLWSEEDAGPGYISHLWESYLNYRCCHKCLLLESSLRILHLLTTLSLWKSWCLWFSHHFDDWFFWKVAASWGRSWGCMPFISNSIRSLAEFSLLFCPGQTSGIAMYVSTQLLVSPECLAKDFCFVG